jgi:hypothetical protein
MAAVMATAAVVALVGLRPGVQVDTEVGQVRPAMEGSA